MSTKTKKTITSTKTKASKEKKTEQGNRKTKKHMLTPKDVAEYFLRLTEPEVGDTLSNLKVQKLLYYAQGFSLALYNKPLFEDDFHAWMYGPAIPSLYDLYKQYGSDAIPEPEKFNVNKYSKKEQELLNEIHWVYGQYSAWKLRDLIYKERPYKETGPNEIISKKLLKEYFLTQIKDEHKKKKK